MTLTIHRGTHEIGGSCVEIRTDKAKILIDLGMPLDYDKHTTEEQTQIRSDAAEWCKGVKRFEGVLCAPISSVETADSIGNTIQLKHTRTRI